MNEKKVVYNITCTLKAIIKYNNRESWLSYTVLSNKYAPEIIETVRIFKHKNERQQAFKHRLDIECFGLKYKRRKSSARKIGKLKHKEVKELADGEREVRIKKTKTLFINFLAIWNNLDFILF